MPPKKSKTVAVNDYGTLEDLMETSRISAFEQKFLKMSQARKNQVLQLKVSRNGRRQSFDGDWTLMHHAAYVSNPRFVELLCQADRGGEGGCFSLFAKRNFLGRNALVVACLQGNTDTVQKILSLCTNDQGRRNLVVESTVTRTDAEVEEGLTPGPLLQFVLFNSERPDVEMVRALLPFVDVNERISLRRNTHFKSDDFGHVYSNLTYLIGFCDKLAEEQLRRYEIGRSEGYIPTETRRDSDIVKLLLDHGANPIHRDAEGWNALHWAVLNERVDLVEAIFEHINLKACTEESEEAVARLQKKVCLELLQGTSGQAKAHPIINRQDEEEIVSIPPLQTPLQIAKRMVTAAGDRLHPLVETIEVLHKNLTQRCADADTFSPLPAVVFVCSEQSKALSLRPIYMAYRGCYEKEGWNVFQMTITEGDEPDLAAVEEFIASEAAGTAVKLLQVYGLESDPMVQSFVTELRKQVEGAPYLRSNDVVDCQCYPLFVSRKSEPDRVQCVTNAPPPLTSSSSSSSYLLQFFFLAWESTDGAMNVNFCSTALVFKLPAGSNDSSCRRVKVWIPAPESSSSSEDSSSSVAPVFSIARSSWKLVAEYACEHDLLHYAAVVEVQVEIVDESSQVLQREVIRGDFVASCPEISGAVVPYPLISLDVDLQCSTVYRGRFPCEDLSRAWQHPDNSERVVQFVEASTEKIFRCFSSDNRTIAEIERAKPDQGVHLQEGYRCPVETGTKLPSLQGGNTEPILLDHQPQMKTIFDAAFDRLLLAAPRRGGSLSSSSMKNKRKGRTSRGISIFASFAYDFTVSYEIGSAVPKSSTVAVVSTSTTAGGGEVDASPTRDATDSLLRVVPCGVQSLWNRLKNLHPQHQGPLGGGAPAFAGEAYTKDYRPLVLLRGPPEALLVDLKTLIEAEQYYFSDEKISTGSPLLHSVERCPDHPALLPGLQHHRDNSSNSTARMGIPLLFPSADFHEQLPSESQTVLGIPLDQQLQQQNFSPVPVPNQHLPRAIADRDISVDLTTGLTGFPFHELTPPRDDTAEEPQKKRRRRE